MEAEVASLNQTEGDYRGKVINPGTRREVRQLHERVYLPVGHDSVPVANYLSEFFVRQASALTDRYPELAQWYPTEAGYQRYRSTEDGISLHRDRRSDELLAITITVYGKSFIRMFESLGDPDDYTKVRMIDEFLTGPGSVMFLRAPGLGNGEQVIHEAVPPEHGSRLVLNLRMRPDILE